MFLKGLIVGLLISLSIGGFVASCSNQMGPIANSVNSEASSNP